MHENSGNFSQIITDSFDAIGVMTIDSGVHTAIDIVERDDPNEFVCLLLVVL